MAGLLSNPWDQYLSPDTQESAYSDLSQNMQYEPINWQRLIDSGAVRITQPGSGTGPEPIITPDPSQFSVVSMHNDQGNSYTRNWPNKPESYPQAIEDLAKPGLLYDGKYRQILWSARELGLNPQDVFMQKSAAPAGLLGGR
jgi:hypothetical protein